MSVFNGQVQEVAENESPWTMWVETLSPESGLQELPIFDKDSKIQIQTIYFSMTSYIHITMRRLKNISNFFIISLNIFEVQ
jgi:hypothetical protein